jgi:hypothetical protein
LELFEFWIVRIVLNLNNLEPFSKSNLSYYFKSSRSIKFEISQIWTFLYQTQKIERKPANQNNTEEKPELKSFEGSKTGTEKEYGPTHFPIVALGGGYESNGISSEHLQPCLPNDAGFSVWRMMFVSRLGTYLLNRVLKRGLQTYFMLKYSFFSFSFQ